MNALAHPASLSAAANAREMILVRVRKAGVLQLDDLQLRELPDTPGLTLTDRNVIDAAIQQRRGELQAAKFRQN